MTSKSVDVELKEIKDKQDLLFKEVDKLKEKLEKFEKNSIIKLKPMVEDQSRIQEFYEEEDWIEKQRSKFPNELIAYINKDNKRVLIAHSDKERDLLKQIDALIKQGKISENQIIFFDS